ncbi:DNA cytosine methyltransferase [Embleya sp. NPDC050154]|uniref:DNA cytosine methyltransferase n=1 Tax=Embleya sp. NPDC050154 TaxID=3363988 RepID=UPI0037ACA1A1
MTLTIGSLCTGAGGLEVAVAHGLDATVAWHVEHDPHASRVLAAHHPDVPNHGDVKSTDWSGIEPVDIVVAGFPCQDISNAGSRKGIIHGRRSSLWSSVAEAVRVLRPEYVFLENVAAIRSRGLDVVAQDLAQVGYDVRWTCVRAGDPETGAPHRRDRWFAVAHPAAADPERCGWDGRPWHVHQTAGRPQPADGGDGTPELAGVVDLLPTPIVGDARGTRNFTSGRSEGARFNSGKTLTDVAWLLPTPKASDGPHGGPNQRDASGRYYLPGQAVRLDEDWVASDGTDYGPAIRRWERAFGHAAPEPTMIGKRGGTTLAPAFAEWMMGLDPGHVTTPDLGIPRAQQLQIIGNGAMWQQAYTAYRWLLRADVRAEAAA